MTNCVQIIIQVEYLTELRFHVPLNTKMYDFRDFLPSQSHQYGTEETEHDKTTRAPINRKMLLT